MDGGGLRKRVRQFIVALYVLACLGCAAMVIGPALNDRTIDANPGRALAEVTDVGWRRTTVDYQDAEGIFHSPPGGVAYPGGLQEGQRVWVTYAVDDPDLVKVEGREWTLALTPAISSWLVCTVVAGLLWWLAGTVGAGRRRGGQADRADRGDPGSGNSAGETVHRDFS